MLEYELIRSNRKTVCITVEKNGKITVKAPYFAKKSEIDEFVIKKRGWIINALQREAIKIKPPEFCNGAEYLIVGRSYRVVYYSGARIREDGSCIYIPEELGERLGKGVCPPAFITLVKKLFLPFITERTRAFSANTGLRFKSVAVSSARTRWGSCNGENAIRYSVFLAFLPIELIDYVILHELCHVRHKNHSQEFWSLVNAFMPDYSIRRSRLHDYSLFLDL